MNPANAMILAVSSARGRRSGNCRTPTQFVQIERKRTPGKKLSFRHLSLFGNILVKLSPVGDDSRQARLGQFAPIGGILRVWLLLASVLGRCVKMSRERAKTILIVEKQPNYTQLLVKQILFVGMNPLVAVTGEGGFRKAIEYHPDLILLELDLTDMEGLRLVSLLKERPVINKIPIVAMSIFSYMKLPALNGGCDDFLTKPVRMLELQAHIRRLLQPPNIDPKKRKYG